MNWEFLIENNINPNQYSILLLLYLKEYNTLKKLLELMWEEDTRLLETDKWIKITGKDTLDMVLRSKAFTLFDKKGTDFQNFVKKYIQLFPKGVRTGGKLVRSDKKDVEVKLQKFLQHYDYTPTIILKATKGYLDKKELEDWKCTRTAVYFIHKRDEGSDLAAECQNFANGNKDNEETVFGKSV